MSVNEPQTLTQKFADAFDPRDLKTVMEMLSEDVRCLTMFLLVRRQAALRQVSQRGLRGHRLGELRLPATIVPHVRRAVGIVNAYDMFTAVFSDRENIEAVCYKRK